MHNGSSRRFDMMALTLVGACVAGLYGAALPDMMMAAAVPQSIAAHEGTPVAGTAAGAAGHRVSSLMPTAPTARLMTLSAPRDEIASRPARIQTRALPHPLPKSLDVTTVHRLYDGLEYGLDTVRQDGAPVPRLFLTSVPEGLDDLHDVEERKSVFLRAMLPLILKVNEDIMADRARLERLIAEGYRVTTLPPTERRWVEAKAAEYRQATPDLRRLLTRMDIIPPSLALAQAAEESGWGTSRFARLGNALFGQWTTEGDDGIVPLGREDGKKHVIKAFPDLLAAVRGYARNLNSHAAYAELRARRAALRATGQPVDGMELSNTLLRYSERGEDYVRTLHVIMRVNDLPAFDTATLGHPRDVIELASLITSATN